MKFVVFWTFGEKSCMEGATISEAFSKTHSAGALAAVDFYCEAKDESQWHVQVDLDGKHSWINDGALERFPQLYRRVDSAPPKMDVSRWNANHHYQEVAQ